MRIRLQGPGHAASLLAELNRCRQSRQYCDVFLQVGNRTFAAHRAVLACSGTYFRNLFARAPTSSASAFSLEFISAANFEKVLMFVYTGEIFTDLIDVGVLYELAERLGIGELVRACHASFPDLQASVSANGKAGSSGDVTLDSSMVAATVPIGGAASVSACSSAASCSSLSSSAVPTPAAAPSPLLQPRTSMTSLEVQTGAESLDLKVEDISSHIGFGQMGAGGLGHSNGSDSSQCEGVPPLRPALPLKTEQGDEEAEGSSEDGGRYGRAISVGSAPPQSAACSFPDSSTQLGNKACDPPSPSGGPICALQVESLEGGVADVRGDGGLTLVDVEEGENGEQREAAGAAEEQQWRGLAGEIIELSDDENFMEEAEEEDDEDDLVCLENGEGGNSSGQPVTCDMCRSQFCSHNKLLRHHRQTASCYAIPPEALTNGGQGLTSELLCAVCSKSLSKDFQSLRDHLLSHVCLQTLRCGVCHLAQPSPCSLLWHALTHLSLPVFSCPHCARCFVERPLLDRHMAAHAEEAAAKERELRVGADGAELQCFLCPQTFPSSSAFLHHLSLHTGEPQGGGGGPGALGRPGKRKANQPVECPPSSCSSSALREVGSLAKTSNLGLNLASGGVSNGSPWPDGAAGAAGVREKWYRCRYCGKRFAHSGEFTYHLRIHTGEKPYQCKVCLRFFRGRSTMICHLKTHAGALMYRCTVCGLYFSTLKLVSSHMELHKDHLPPDFNIEQTFMYSDHSKEPLPPVDT